MARSSKKPYAASEFQLAEQLENLAFHLETESENIKLLWPNLPCTGMGEAAMDYKAKELWLLLWATAKWLRMKATWLKEEGLARAVEV